MKKIKLFKFIIIGLLSTIAVSALLVASLASCNRYVTNSKEVTTSDNETKLSLLDNIQIMTNNCELKNPYSW